MTFQYSDISLDEFPGYTSLVIYSGGCNYHCPYCFNPDLRKKEPISFKLVKKACEEHIDFIDAVVLTGGEPYLNPQLSKIIRYVKSKGLKIKINTNGFTPLKNDNFPIIIDHVDYLHISLKDANTCIM